MYKLRIGSFSDLVGARLNLPMKSWSYTFNSFLTRFFSFWSSSNENPTRCFPWIFDVSKLSFNRDSSYFLFDSNYKKFLRSSIAPDEP